MQLARNLVSYVIAADLIDLRAFRPELDGRFRTWLDTVRRTKFRDGSLISEDRRRANNHGRVAGAARVAAAAYLGDTAELTDAAKVFAGFLGDRRAYAAFEFDRDRSWQAVPGAPVGINHAGAHRGDVNLDGALPEEMRRGAPFAWPPTHTDYPWGALQGALLEARLLERANPEWQPFEWQHNALLRAVEFLWRAEQHFGGWWARTDDLWIPWFVNATYGTRYPTAPVNLVGKNFGWSDWLWGWAVGDGKSSGGPGESRRVSGTDRYETSAAMAAAAFPAGADVAVLASGEHFADALAATPLAAAKRAPLLLTAARSLPAPIAAELRRLSPGVVFVVGGEQAVGPAVMSELAAVGMTATRIAGPDRFATAVSASQTAFGERAPVVFVANGGGYADALAGGAAAGVLGGPLLLSARDTLPEVVVGELRRLRPDNVVILGGPAAVSDAVEHQLRTLAPAVGRSAGADRYRTAVAVAVNAFSTAEQVFIVSGEGFADALSAGAAAAATRAPLLLTPRSCLHGAAAAQLGRLRPATVTFVGGSGALEDRVVVRTRC